MSDVFLSYAHEDHAAAAEIARRLGERGWSVFWDRTSLVPGQEFGRVIEDELAHACCVVVLWSRASADARWVRAEAGAAVERDVALPVLLEDVAMPLLFRQVLAADLKGWDGEGDHPGLASLFRAIERRITSARERAVVAPPPQGPAPEPERAGDAWSRTREALRRSTTRRGAAAGLAVLLVAALALWRWGPGSGAGADHGATLPLGGTAPTPSPPVGGGSVAGEDGPVPAAVPAEGDLFSLEVLDAGHGDCYLLHHGAGSEPRFALLDGGYTATYRTVLRPRLEQLRRTWSRGRSLPLELVAVSQTSDHRIGGVLHLFRDLRAAREQGLEPAFAIERLWFNGFEVPAAAPSVLPGGVGPAPAVLAVHRAGFVSGPGGNHALRLASVRQGQTLLADARYLGLAVNRPFDRLVMLPEEGAARLSLEGGLTVTVLGPARERVLELFDDWIRRMRQDGQLSAEGAARLHSRRDELTTETFSDPLLGPSASARSAPRRTPPTSPPVAVVPAAYRDESVYNLASIVLLLEKGGKRILLTGDARGDHVLAGLRQAGLLSADGTVHFDVLQVPHQGSNHSVEPGFFEAVLADRYVINGNGRHGNPETETLRMITGARGDAKYSLYFTHPDGEDELRARLEGFFDAERSLGRRYDVFFRARDSSAMRINLLEAVRY